MRITRIQLVGLATVLAGANAGAASANDVTITTATTAPLLTSLPDNVSPGDVTIAAAGSITVTAGQTAVTVNTSNDVSNAGTIASNDADNSTGILLQGGNTGTITNSSALNLLENYTLADTDNDGDLDGAFASGTNRHGIRLQAGPAFTGDIVNSGTITVEGQNSGGIRLDGLLTGNLTSSGPLSVIGENSTGIALNGGAAGGVSGDVLLRGGVTVRGQNSSGLVVGAPIGGELRVNGAWSATGFHSATRPINTAALEAEDLLIGGAPIAIHFSVGEGVTIEGIGVEDDLDDDRDGITETTGDANDDLAASINSFGSAPALLIRADPSANLALGPIVGPPATLPVTPNPGAGFGLHVRGSVTASGVYDNIAATGIRIVGDAGGSLTTTAAGVAIDGAVIASAPEANAYGIHIGDNAIVPTLQVRGRISSAVGSDTALFNSNAVFLDVGADVATLSNSGALDAQLFGEIGTVTTVRDLSNTLATINNSGTILALITATDSNTTDNIPPPTITGSAVAIDVSASSIGVTLNQQAYAVFTDDDNVDNDATINPPRAVRITGDILFGSGADIVNLDAGSIIGDLSFGAGADDFFIRNGASYSGRLTDAGGQLDIDVINGVLALDAGITNIGTAHFGADSEFSPSLVATGQSTFINAGGAVTFDVGARIAPRVPVGLPDSGSNIIFLTAAGGLSVDAGSLGAVTGANVPFLYNLSVGLASGDPNSLAASFLLKTPTQLGLGVNEALAYSSIIDALQTDVAASAAMASLDTAAEFANAYDDLMPSYNSSAAELAATAILQAQGATSNRLAATRLHNLDDVSVWAQEIGYALERTPLTGQGQQFEGNGFGFAFGIDGPLNSGGLFGLSGSFIASQVEESQRPSGEVSAWFGQVNAYLGAGLGPIDLDFIAGGGVGKMKSSRVVEIGSAFSALSEAEWMSYEGHASVRAAAPWRLANWMVITPQAALTYVALMESGYTEEGGGTAIDYKVDDANSQRLWGDAGIEFSARIDMGGGATLAPRLFAGYRSNVLDEETERTVRFASGGADVTLTDEPLGDGAPLVGIGIDSSNGSSTFSLSYEGEYGDQLDRHSINASVRFKF